MKHIIFTLAISLLTFSSAYAGSTKYYSTVSVSADSGKGLVYVSESNAQPADANYKETMELSLSGKDSETTTIYLFGKAATEGEELIYWLDANGTKILDSSVQIKGSENQSSPNTYSYKAVFGMPVAVKVSTNNVNYGSASISNVENSIGDEITITATPAKVPTYGCKNQMIRFAGWKRLDNGSIVSKNPKYTFTPTERMELEAEFELLSSIKASGYYRIRNIFNRVLAIEGNFKYQTDDPAYLDGLVRWALPDDYVKADFNNKTWNGSDDNPAVDAEGLACAVIWMEGTSLNENAGADGEALKTVNLFGQGTDIKTMTGNTFTLKVAAENVPGHHFLYGNVLGAGFKMTHYEMDEDHDGDGKTDGHFAYCRPLIGRAKVDDPYSWMALQPIDEEHFDDFWFGASANESMKFDNGYWTSMYTGFPYECRDGVEAYYVTTTEVSNGTHYLQLEKIESGIVPAYSAVLLKCKGTRSRENRLMPLPFKNDYGTLEGNLLEGSFSLYTSAEKQSDPAGSNANYAYYKKSGRPVFNENHRVLSVNAEGIVGFYKMAANEDGTARMLEPNKVYLDITKLENGAKSAPLRLKINKGNESGIIDIHDEEATTSNMEKEFYTIDGRKIANPEHGHLYIMRQGTKVSKVLY